MSGSAWENPDGDPVPPGHGEPVSEHSDGVIPVVPRCWCGRRFAIGMRRTWAGTEYEFCVVHRWVMVVE